MESSLPIVLVLGHRFASLDVEHATLSGVAKVLDGNTIPGKLLADTLQAASVVMLGTKGRLDAGTIATNRPSLATCRGSKPSSSISLSTTHCCKALPLALADDGFICVF